MHAVVGLAVEELVELFCIAGISKFEQDHRLIRDHFAAGVKVGMSEEVKLEKGNNKKGTISSPNHAHMTDDVDCRLHEGEEIRSSHRRGDS